MAQPWIKSERIPLNIDLTIEELAAIYALMDCQKIGVRRARILLSHYRAAQRVFESTPPELASVAGFEKQLADALQDCKVRDDHWEKARRIKETGTRIFHFLNSNYPERLRQVPDAPILLYGVGELKEADDQAIAVVGTRSSSKYGNQVTRELTTELVKNGFTIVSGLARGIDTEAHTTALDSGGRTIAVLGSGIDQIYPRENTALAKKIAQQGMVCTEYYLGTDPDAKNFPERNRIISGLSLGTVVIEAGHKSGAILTALIALEQNREVFAVPGRIDSKRSIGANRLIKHGAKLVQTVDDILEELSGQLDFQRNQKPKVNQVDLSPDEESVYKMLSDEPVHIDEIAQSLGQPSPKVLTILLGMELKSIVEQLPGKNFKKA
ncbi:MAG: DNA-processing protein DprA [Candidatus Marinimicrobia bacterium]|nr:DNA-processing protein DprA [Candidatus Neomarinimicrobiota bacterium]MCF7827720.1 DNA-processing protein DprA [Candidatus Neomarinimicrobiota bacterium]MCF7881225.1 DNA-processing protein DprA [Candidatus Neomarinimicrobiota bacterium]